MNNQILNKCSHYVSSVSSTFAQTREYIISELSVQKWVNVTDGPRRTQSNLRHAQSKVFVFYIKSSTWFVIELYHRFEQHERPNDILVNLVT